MSTVHTPTTGMKSHGDYYTFSTDTCSGFQVIVLLRGTLKFHTMRIRRVLSSGDMLVLRPGSAVSLNTGKGGYSGVYFLQKDNFADWMKGESFCCRTAPFLRTLVREIEREFQAPSPNKEGILSAMGPLLAAYARRELEAHEMRPITNVSSYWADFAAQAIRTNVYTDLPLKDIFANTEISYRQIMRYFRAENGTSLKEYQMRTKIDEAKLLLENPSNSITAISAELGFSSSQHFADLFKRFTGSSASDHRRRSIRRGTHDARYTFMK